MRKVTPIHRTINLPRRQQQTWEQSDSSDSQKGENLNSKKINKNKDLK